VTETLERDVLTRATAQRQWLDRRAEASAADAVAHLAGIQAQEPLEPYAGLWSRLAGFRAEHLVALLEERQAVRTITMRRTIHLHSAAEARALRPLCDPMLRQRMLGVIGKELPGVDVDELAGLARPLFEGEPRPPGEVARELAPRWPGVPPRWLADAIVTLVPLVQVPPRGVWGESAGVRCTTYDVWLGTEHPAQGERDPAEDLRELVRRYLRAYGPATSSDLRAWCGLSGLPAVVEDLEPELVAYRDERGRRLLDLAGLTLPTGPAADEPLPPRFVPSFDNVVLGYADRTRVIDDEHKHLSILGARYLLIEGRVAGTWVPAPGARGGVDVEVTALRRISRPDRAEAAEEGAALAAFLGDGAAGRVRWV
jgi:hypothetical protein